MSEELNTLNRMTNMIRCKICHQEFARLITNTHLKTHQLSLKKYQLMFGGDSTVDPSYRLEKMKSKDSTIRQKISAGMKKYAQTHQLEMKQRAQKAIQTKLENGQDLAFFAGKQHSEKSKKMISLKKIRK